MIPQLPDPLPGAGDHREHRHAEQLRQLPRVDFVAVFGGDIDHVQRDGGRVAQFDGLRGVVEIALEVRGIDDDHDEARRRHFGEPMEEDISGDLFVERLRAEAVRARQVEHGDRRVLRGAEQAAFLTLDGHARVIADLCAQAGQRVEQRGLAAVGVAGQDDARR